MPSIGFLAQKGGVGKTTLCVHLAVLAGDALVVDLDSQRSATEWWETRSADRPELAHGAASELKHALATPRRKWVLVDTAPHAAEDARIVAEAVDLVVIPTRPTILDLRAIRATVEIVHAAGARAVIILNACPPSRGLIEVAAVTEARRALTIYQVPVAPIAVTQRTALERALILGSAVIEYEPGGKAADELRRLWRWINGQIRRPVRPEGAAQAR